MRAPPSLCCVALGLCITGCPEEEEACSDYVVARADPTIDFTAIANFAVVEEADYPTVPEDLPDNADVDIARATAAARSQLIALGLQEVDDQADADVVLVTAAATGSETGQVWQCVPGYVWWGYYGYVWDPCAWMELVTVEYEVGTLLLALAQPMEERVVFGGMIQGALACGDVTQRIDEGVEDIFEDYPIEQTGQ